MKKIIFSAFFFLLFWASAYAENKVLVIQVHSEITPKVKNYIDKSIKKAEKDNSSALVIDLNTNGGFLETTREIVNCILSSKVPVVVYVSPYGAHAASAGAFITLSAHIAAMAPSSNIGACHPVADENYYSKIIIEKATNDAAAFLKSLAEKRNRNTSWALNAVYQSISTSAEQALNEKVIDHISVDLNELLRQINNSVVYTSVGKKEIHTNNAVVEFKYYGFKDEMLDFLSDPNIAYILLMIGIFGLLFEIFNPGAIFPGVIGAISLLISTYSFQLLSVNYTGLLLIILSISLFLLELKFVSHGLLAIGGIVFLFFGSVMLFDSPNEIAKVSMGIIITVEILTVLFFFFVITLGLKAQKKEKFGSNENLKGETAVALIDFVPGESGKVRIHGEIWKAECSVPVSKNDKLEVVEIKLLTLFVKPK